MKLVLIQSLDSFLGAISTIAARGWIRWEVLRKREIRENQPHPGKYNIIDSIGQFNPKMVDTHRLIECNLKTLKKKKNYVKAKCTMYDHNFRVKLENLISYFYI